MTDTTSDSKGLTHNPFANVFQKTNKDAKPEPTTPKEKLAAKAAVPGKKKDKKAAAAKPAEEKKEETPSLPERPMEVTAAPQNTEVPAKQPEKPVFRGATVLGGGRLIAKQKHFENLVQRAISGELKPQMHDGKDGVSPCSMDPKYQASGTDFIVQNGQMYGVSKEYAEAANKLTIKVRKSLSYNHGDTGRLIKILTKEKALSMKSEDLEYAQLREDITKKDASRAAELQKEWKNVCEVAQTWFTAMKDNEEAGVKMYAFPVGGFNNPDTLEQYEEYIKSVSDPLNPGAIITSVVVFGHTVGDAEEDDGKGNLVVLKNQRFFRAAFVSGRTAKALREIGAEHVHAIFKGNKDKGERILTLSHLYDVRDTFFPKERHKK